MRIAVLLFVLLLAAVGCGGSSDGLVGRWVDVDLPVYELELEADKTGVERWTDTGAESTLTWTADGEELCLTYDDGSESCRQFSVEGDRLSVELPSGGMGRMERWPGN